MIPYEELVVALQSWRAKKGLPITQMSGSFAPPPAAVAPPPAAAPRTAPPTPAPRAKPAAPPEHETLDAASLLDEEDSYQNEGNDFAMEFPHSGAADESEAGESTQIGSPPARPSDLATDPGFDSVARGNKRNTDW